MTEIEIGIGETSSYRYFGIKPPIDEELAEKITEQLELPFWVGDFQTVYVLQEAREDCPDHTLLGIQAGEAIDVLGEDEIDRDTVKIAKQIVGILELAGIKVTLNSEIVTTDYENPLFGKYYYEMLDTFRLFANRKSS